MPGSGQGSPEVSRGTALDALVRRWLSCSHARRGGSIFLSVPLARLDATPNGITVAWILIGLGV